MVATFNHVLGAKVSKEDNSFPSSEYSSFTNVVTGRSDAVGVQFLSRHDSGMP